MSWFSKAKDKYLGIDPNGHGLTGAVKSIGDNAADQWKEFTDNPGEKLGDYAKSALTGGAGFILDVATLAPLWNGGRSMGYDSMFGGSRDRNDAWGDVAGVNARRDMEAQEAEQQRLIEEQQRQIAENVKRTGAVYGFGSSPEAQANARRLGDIIGSQVQGQGGQAAAGMSADLQQQLQQLSAMFARSGMTGSGLEQQSLQEAIAGYGARRSSLGTSLEGLRQSLYDTLRSRSQSAQEAAAGGQNIAPDAMYRDQIASLNTALTQSPLASGLEGIAGGVNTGANAVLARVGGASPEALQRALDSMRYEYNTGTGG